MTVNFVIVAAVRSRAGSVHDACIRQYMAWGRSLSVYLLLASRSCTPAPLGARLEGGGRDVRREAVSSG